MNLLQMVDELRVTLENLIGREYADAIYNEVKAEANLYDICCEIERMHCFVRLAAAGCDPTHMLIAAKEQLENHYLNMLWRIKHE